MGNYKRADVGSHQKHPFNSFTNNKITTTQSIYIFWIKIPLIIIGIKLDLFTIFNLPLLNEYHRKSLKTQIIILKDYISIEFECCTPTTLIT